MTQQRYIFDGMYLLKIYCAFCLLVSPILITHYTSSFTAQITGDKLQSKINTDAFEDLVRKDRKYSICRINKQNK